MWTVAPEPVEGHDAVALLRQYFAELTVRWFHRETSEQEVDATLEAHPTAGLALFLVLRAHGVPAGCLGVHSTGELTRLFVVPERRGAGGGRVLLAAAEGWARQRRLERLFLDTRTDLVEARALYASCGFTELPPPAAPRTRFQDHWFEKRLRQPGEPRPAEPAARPGPTRQRDESGAPPRDRPGGSTRPSPPAGHAPGMSLPIVGIRQIKLPVSDLARSARWYTDLFGLELALEFHEDSAVRGVVLADRAAGFVIGLRQREHCASTPVLDGFDVCAFLVSSPEQMAAVAARCEELGIAHGDVHDRGEFGTAMDVPDPDGTVLRFVAGPHTGPPGTFTGLDMAPGPPTVYDRPRLDF